MFGDITRYASQRLSGAFHHLIDVWGWGEQASEVADRELDTIQDLGEWVQISQLSQAPE
jgi:hypothetical protein